MFLLIGETTVSIRGILEVLQFAGKDWFTKSYITLMILAPALNCFSQQADEKTQRYAVLSYMLFEAIYCWAANGAKFFLMGYGPLHFIGLYMTAQYIHNQLSQESTPNIIKKMFSLPKRVDLGIYVFTVVLNTILLIEGSYTFKDVETFHALAYAYNNPLVIIGALYLLLFFKGLNIGYLRFVNWMGASSFAVYLLHTQTTFFENYFSPQIQYFYSNYIGVVCLLMIFFFLCCIYGVSVLIDQIRILSWNKLWNLASKS